MGYTIISLNPQNGGEYRDLDLKVHSNHGKEHDASVGLDNAAKEYITLRNQEGNFKTQTIFTAPSANGKWDALSNGFYAVSPIDAEREVMVYEKYTRPGKVFGVYHKSKIVRVFLMVGEDEVEILKFNPKPSLNSANNNMNSNKQTGGAGDYHSVISELKNVLEKRQSGGLTKKPSTASQHSVTIDIEDCFIIPPAPKFVQTTTEKKVQNVFDQGKGFEFNVIDYIMENGHLDNVKVGVNPLFQMDADSDEESDYQSEQESDYEDEVSDYQSEEEVYQKVNKDVICFIRPYNSYDAEQEEDIEEEYESDYDFESEESESYDSDQVDIEDDEEDIEKQKVEELGGFSACNNSVNWDNFKWDFGSVENTNQFFTSWGCGPLEQNPLNVEPLFPTFSLTDTPSSTPFSFLDLTEPLLTFDERTQCEQDLLGDNCEMTGNAASEWLESYQQIVNEWKTSRTSDVAETLLLLNEDSTDEDMPSLVLYDYDSEEGFDNSISELTSSTDNDSYDSSDSFSSLDNSVFTDEEEEDYLDVVSTPQTLTDSNTPGAPFKNRVYQLYNLL